LPKLTALLKRGPPRYRCSGGCANIRTLVCSNSVQNARALRQGGATSQSVFEMRVMNKAVFLLLTYSVIFSAVADSVADGPLLYRGASDASAAVALSNNTFIVADDENNVLRVYKTNGSRQGPPLIRDLPVSTHDLTAFLDIEPEHPEADIEGATMISDRIYWITSHGRNKDGKMRPNRYRFFATTVKADNGNVTIHPVGLPYKTLIHKLLKTEAMRHLQLDKATRFDAGDLKKKQREKLAPKEQGLNIEALCASADGKTLYIGFRNPRPYDKKDPAAKALLVPLRNADSVVRRGDSPIFGEPILWDLAGLGIRSMEYSPQHKAYFVVAGPHDEAHKFVLYRWSGKKNEPPKPVRQLGAIKSDFSPEALVAFKDSPRFLLLSDDGALPVRVRDRSECMEDELNDDGTCPNKFLTDPKRKTFKAMWLTP